MERDSSKKAVSSCTLGSLECSDPSWLTVNASLLIWRYFKRRRPGRIVWRIPHWTSSILSFLVLCIWRFRLCCWYNQPVSSATLLFCVLNNIAAWRQSAYPAMPTRLRRLRKIQRRTKSEETNKNNLTVMRRPGILRIGREYLYRFEFKDGWDSSTRDYGSSNVFVLVVFHFQRHPGTHSIEAIDGAQWNVTREIDRKETNFWYLCILT